MIHSIFMMQSCEILLALILKEERHTHNFSALVTCLFENVIFKSNSMYQYLVLFYSWYILCQLHLIDLKALSTYLSIIPFVYLSWRESNSWCCRRDLSGSAISLSTGSIYLSNGFYLSIYRLIYLPLPPWEDINPGPTKL